MFSLLVIIGLQVSVESAGIRPERSFDRHYSSELMVQNGGGWGSWGDREMCPTGTYAAGFSLKVLHPSTHTGLFISGKPVSLCFDLMRFRKHKFP
ncbi:hypothetical protein QQF64_018190 [Cirrhinus molitorella]|uniref:Uncharacterized protein n=1 Tax=Cirrhinus molitorella TaxID=172907 RepID=A0ABR3LPE5_9TELE